MNAASDDEEVQPASSEGVLAPIPAAPPPITGGDRAADYLVAERVMGWRPLDPKWRSLLMIPPDDYQRTGGGIKFAGEDGLAIDVPKFTSEIAPAWSVLEHLRSQGWCVERIEDVARYYRSAEQWEVTLRHADDRRGCGARGGTPAIAICRAALLAVRPREEWRT